MMVILIQEHLISICIEIISEKKGNWKLYFIFFKRIFFHYHSIQFDSIILNVAVIFFCLALINCLFRNFQNEINKKNNILTKNFQFGQTTKTQYVFFFGCRVYFWFEFLYSNGIYQLFVCQISFPFL